MNKQESATFHESTTTDGSEWSSSRRSGRRARNAVNRALGEKLRVDLQSETETEKVGNGNDAGQSHNEEKEERETGHGQKSTGSDNLDQLKEPVIPVTILASMEAETKSASSKDPGVLSAEHVRGKDGDEETEDDIALLEYLSGTESDYYELDRASRKEGDGEDFVPIMSLSPRSFDESLGTPGSPCGLLSVDEHGGFVQSLNRRMVAHSQEVLQEASTQRMNPPASVDNLDEGAESIEAKTAVMSITPQTAGTGATTSTGENEWIACKTEDGLTYYYNLRTQVSQWTLPATLGAQPYTNEELFAIVATDDMTETESRRLSMMLHSGMDLQVVNSDGLTPLHVACKMKNEQAAALLIYYGVKLEARALSDDATPLIFACRAESEGITKLLLESNASLSACDSNDDTALHVAVHSGNEDLVMLVLRDCDHALLSQKNKKGETALHIAAKLGSFGIVRSLLAHGAKAKDEDSQGRTPLILSILENHVECVQLLQNAESSAGSAKPNSPLFYTSAYSSESRQGSERDALTVLHAYLFQILPNQSDSESQTVYQLFEEVRGQLGALNASLLASNSREAHYREKVDEMSMNLATSVEDLKKEQTLHTDTRNHLTMRELELEASRVSHRALSSRCELLESIARNAQEKLGRERLEHVHYEEIMQEKLQRSLQENANVIDSCTQLQANWSERRHPPPYDLRLGRRDSQGFYEISEDLSRLGSVHGSIKDNYHLVEAEGSPRTPSGNQSRERTSNGFQHEYYQKPHGQHHQYRHSFEEYHDETAPENLDPTSLLDEVRTRKGSTTPPVSPARVGAVWNRFFENVGHSRETHDRSSSKPLGPLSVGIEKSTPMSISSSQVFDAVRKSDLHRLQEVLLRGISPNQRDVAEKGSPLHLACELGDIDSVMLLSEFAADLEARDEAGNTPLLAACLQGNFECVKFLLQSAVSLRAVNENNDSALHLAAWDGSISCVMILLEYGVDPMATNRFGLTALGNMKTRSPMRHKFDDLPEDHPMHRTLVVLEEAERQQLQVLDDRSMSTEDANEHQVQPKQSRDTSKRTSWTQWFLGFRPQIDERVSSKPDHEEQKSEAGDANMSTTATEDNEVDSEDADDLASYEEFRLSETQYEPLTPPPEIEEALQRAKAGQLGRYESTARTHPITRQDVSNHINLSPSFRNPTKPHPVAAPSTVRARYVDTFAPV